MKTNELTGPALDWAVAKCKYGNAAHTATRNAYSTDWYQGGPIIERGKIQITPDEPHNMWRAFMTYEGVGYEYWGPTPLIASMRCYVASELGDEVGVPDETI